MTRELQLAAEIVFDNTVHYYEDLVPAEAAIEEGVKIYESICGEKPNLEAMGYKGWFDKETTKEIMNGTWQHNHTNYI